VLRMCDTRPVQDLPRSRGWTVLGFTAVYTAAGYFVLRYVFHFSLWWLLSFFPLVVMGVWMAWRPASLLRFSKKVEEAMNTSSNFPRNFFP
jgi:predicted tellurium resistance membrane protein TerC